MKALIWTLFALSLSGIATAEETLLTCVENAGEGVSEIETVTIRFDEEQGTFELFGKAMWSVKKDDDGGAKVDEITFTPNTITVKFKRRSALWLSLGAAIASGGRVGVLDRVTGTWTLGSHTYKCERFTEVQRQF